MFWVIARVEQEIGIFEYFTQKVSNFQDFGVIKLLRRSALSKGSMEYGGEHDNALSTSHSTPSIQGPFSFMPETRIFQDALIIRHDFVFPSTRSPLFRG